MSETKPARVAAYASALSACSLSVVGAWVWAGFKNVAEAVDCVRL